MRPASTRRPAGGNPAPPLAMEYVLPLRWGSEVEPGAAPELASYLERLAGWLVVTVVDGSPSEVWARHHALFATFARHVAPEPWPGGNGKVAVVVTGVTMARHEHVVIADDDVRWDRRGLARLDRLL